MEGCRFRPGTRKDTRPSVECPRHVAVGPGTQQRNRKLPDDAAITCLGSDKHSVAQTSGVPSKICRRGQGERRLMPREACEMEVRLLEETDRSFHILPPASKHHPESNEALIEDRNMRLMRKTHLGVNPPENYMKGTHVYRPNKIDGRTHDQQRVRFFFRGTLDP